MVIWSMTTSEVQNGSSRTKFPLLCWSLFSVEWLPGLYGTLFWSGCCVPLNPFLLQFPLSFSFFPPIPKFLYLESRPQEMWLLSYAAPRKSVESVNQSPSLQRLIDTGGCPCSNFRSHELTFFEKRVLADVSKWDSIIWHYLGWSPKI